MGEWQVEVRGRAHRVTTHEAPNGKLIVRVDGRVAGPAMSTHEVEYVFVVDDEPYVLTREQGGLRIAPAEEGSLPMFPSRERPERTSLSSPEFNDKVLPRVIVFIIIGMLWLIVSAALGVAVTRAGRRSVAQLEVIARGDGVIASQTWLRNAAYAVEMTGGAFRGQAFVGVLLALGGGLLLSRTRWAPILIEIALWCMLLTAMWSFLVLDVFVHEQTKLVYQQGAAVFAVARLHGWGFIGLGALALIVGGLLKVLDRPQLIEFLEG